VLRTIGIAAVTLVVSGSGVSLYVHEQNGASAADPRLAHRLLLVAHPHLVPPQAGVRPSDIYVMNDDGTGRRSLTRSRLNEMNAYASPDGRHIAFTRRDADGHGLWILVMRADGTSARKIGPGRLCDYPWSPDGSRLLYTSSKGAYVNFGPINVMNVDGTGRRRLTTGSQDRRPRWSPDGRKIVFERGLWDGPKTMRGTFEIIAHEHTWGDVLWSPDGRQLLFSREYFMPGTIDPGLYVIDAHGRRQTRIVALRSAGITSYAWSPTGRTIAYTTYPDQGLLAINPAGGRLRKLTNLPVDSDPVWSPDGAQILFGSENGITVIKADVTHMRSFSLGPRLVVSEMTWIPAR
jgi:Tol biopolymer transport system component